MEITNHDIYQEIKKMSIEIKTNRELAEKTLSQAKNTSGRLLIVENDLISMKSDIFNSQSEIKNIQKVSVGNWIRNNPAKFTIALLTVSSMYVSNSRELIIGLLKGLL